MAEKKQLSRRKFIEQAGCAALGSTTLLSSLLSLNALSALASPSVTADDDYKAIVCVLLSGGCDTFNVLVPMGDEYSDYALTRGGMALQESRLLPLSVQNSNGRTFGVHPSMPNVQKLFNNGNAAFLAGIGTLVHPIESVNDYKNNKYKVPKGLYSHSDQIQQWQTSVPNDRTVVKGWAGRMADILHSMNGNTNLSMNISLSGRNVFQSGESVVEYAIKSSGVEGVRSFDGGRRGWLNRIRDNAMDNVLAMEYANVFSNAYANMNRNTLAAYADFSHAVEGLMPFATSFSDHRLSQDLQMVAKVMATRTQLNMNRQTFFVNYGGWDHHSNLIESQEVMLANLDNAIGEFFGVLDELGLKDKVTLFTISDFGRTLTSNNSGTDHAWGGNMLVAGGAVHGNQIYGSYPMLYLNDNPQVTSGRGTVIPNVSTDEYFAELALWFGLAPGNLSDILPNINNFYSPGSGQLPLGFLKV